MNPSPAAACAGFVVCGQACFVTMMACCLAIRPSALAVQRGFSYYGTRVETVIPYSLGFAMCAVFTALAIARMPLDIRPSRHLRSALVAILVLLAGIPLTPYNADLVLDWLHIGFTSGLFLLAFAVGAWLALVVLGDTAGRWLFAAQTAGGLLSLISQLGFVPYMIPGQFLFQVAFATMLVRTLRRLSVSLSTD